MNNLSNPVVNKIKSVLNHLKSNYSYERDELEVKLINDIRLALDIDNPIYVFESGIGLDRQIAYLIAAIAHAQSSNKKLVISTSHTAHLPGLIDKIERLNGAFAESFEYKVISSEEEFSDVDVYITTHTRLTESVLLDEDSLIPSPNKAVYVIDEAHRLEELVCARMKSSLTINNVLTLFESVNVDTTQVESVLLSIKGLLASQHRNIFRSGSTHLFQFGVMPTELYDLLVKLQFLVAKIAITNSEGETFASLARSLIGLLSCFDGDTPIAKWVEYEGDYDYTISAQPISMVDVLQRRFWSNHSGVLLTSSSLQMVDGLSPTGRSFMRFLHSIGLNYSCCNVKSYQASNEVFEQCSIQVPKLPFQVTSDEFSTWLRFNIFEYLNTSSTSLALFTSYSMMDSVRNHIESACTSHGILIQCEGDRPVEEIIKFHNKALNQGFKSVIFGLTGYADKLSNACSVENLLLIRLPFLQPDEPHTKAKAEYEQSLGHLSFYTMSLPQVSIELAQSLYKIVNPKARSRCVVFDRRIVDKSYSDALLVALPPIQMKVEN